SVRGRHHRVLRVPALAAEEQGRQGIAGRGHTLREAGTGNGRGRTAHPSGWVQNRPVSKSPSARMEGDLLLPMAEAGRWLGTSSITLNSGLTPVPRLTNSPVWPRPQIRSPRTSTRWA